ncbi:MAG: precorrin-4 C(11)-methyltransferase [Candidatus Tectomicrobia bacterium]|uniref:Precorrin-4 C(11)-methyltransferase n=1 Tax=Tectimicrobiota bacterium TaxID=2528274 RepID=A0A932FVL5_UNCTE|nr:precorrin-4 C(11)-methyltransferase [Candidatus Tectomicrobia bacterium]
MAETRREAEHGAEQGGGRVFFIGAGPGDPELLTLKGKRILQEADLVIYAGSLVNPELLAYAREGAEICDSASLTLEEIFGRIAQAFQGGKVVVRLQTGDPSIYGALDEQLRLLEAHGIPYEVVPGVSSAMAAAATLRQEFTVPEVCQTVILTRLEGRTPVPERERLSRLAQIQATLVIFLSLDRIDKVVEELAAGYPPQTPVAVVYRASWPEEKVIRGTLAEIAGKVREAGLNRQGLILVGEALGLRQEREDHRSRLYHGDFPHGFRP